MLQLQNVTKKFGKFTAVDNLSFEIKSGELFGFLGPNGAGKTTTIKMITGLLIPSSGSIIINDIDTNKNFYEAKKIIGYIPDQPFIYDKLTGREFLLFSGGLYNLNNHLLKDKVDDVIEKLKISSWIDRRTEEYSQGMKERVVIASALIHNPDIIIIDEPMVGLDPQSTKIIKELLIELSEKGKTILMSTHSLYIVEEICNRIGIIKEGKLIYDDKIENVKEFFNSEKKNLESFFLELTQ